MREQAACTFTQIQRQAGLAQLVAQIGHYSADLLSQSINRLTQSGHTTDSTACVGHDIRNRFQCAIECFAQLIASLAQIQGNHVVDCLAQITQRILGQAVVFAAAVVTTAVVPSAVVATTTIAAASCAPVAGCGQVGIDSRRASRQVQTITHAAA